MNKKFVLLSVLIAFALVFSGCECNNNGNQPTTGFTPNFAGTWKLTDSSKPGSTPIVMTIRPSKREPPSSPGGIFMEGLYGPNSMVSGTANGKIFVGTITVPRMMSWAASIEMQMVAPDVAQALYRSTTSYNAVKVAP